MKTKLKKKYKGWGIYKADNGAWYLSDTGEMFPTLQEAKTYIDEMLEEVA